MKTKSKNLFISLLSLLVVISVALSLGFYLTNNKVYASTEQAVVEELAFYVENGAEVRAEEDFSGIRFVIKISKGFYNKVKDKNPSWGVIIGKNVADASDLNLAAVDNNNVKLHAKSGEMKPTLVGDKYVIHAVITYHNASNFLEACNTKLNARAYVTYTVGENENLAQKTEYSSTNTDSFRSISQVAEMALVKNAWTVESQEKILKAFVNDATKVVSEKTAYSEDMFEDGEKKLTGVDVADGTYSLTINGVSMDGEYTVTNGEISLGTGKVFKETLGLTLGNTYTITLSNGTTKYIQNFKYVSDTISTIDEFNNIISYYKSPTSANGQPTVNADTNGFYNGEQSVIPRYYLLTQDISGYKGTVTTSFYDILDGDGHTVTCASLSQRGIFGLYLDGTVKNVNLTVNGKLGDTDLARSVTIAQEIRNGAVIENVVIDLSKATLRDNVTNFGCVTNDSKSGSTIKDLYINIGNNENLSAIDKNETGTAYGGYLGNITATAYTNVRVVSSKIKKLSYYLKDTTDNVYSAKNDNIEGYIATTKDIYRYDTAEAMIAKGVTKVGNWVINADGTASWDGDSFTAEQNEIRVYRATDLTLKVNGVEYNGYKSYSVDNVGIVEIVGDTVKGVSEGEVTITVTYQINGEVKTKSLSLSVVAETEYLVKDNVTEYQIVYPNDSYSKYAQELVYFFKEATGAILGVIDDEELTYDRDSKYISLGATSLVTQAGVTYDKEEIGKYGGRIITEGDSIFILGDNYYNVLNGIYAFLEYEFDYDFYFKDTYDLTKKDTVEFKDYDITDIPDISPTRALSESGWFSDKFDTGITQGERYKMTTGDTTIMYLVGTYEDGARVNHNAFNILNTPDANASTHPEWYATNYSTDGERPTLEADSIKDSKQICFTAHGDKNEFNAMVDTVAAAFAEIINNNQGKTVGKYIVFGIEDNTNFCKCDACKTNIETYGCNSASAIIFMNALAVAVNEKTGGNQGVKYIFNAYEYFAKAPVEYNNATGKYELINGLTLHDDVGVFLALKFRRFDEILGKTEDNGVDYYGSIYNDRNQEQTVEEVKRWADICDTLMLWTYDINSFIPDIKNAYYDDDYYKTLANFDLEYLFPEGPSGKGAATSFNLLKGYLNSKLTWNTSLDSDELVNKFFNAMYGAGSTDMLAYYNSLKEWCEAIKMNTTAGGEVNFVSTYYWDFEELKSWYEACDKAVTAINSSNASNEVKARLLLNVNIERVSIDFLLSELYGDDEFTKGKLIEIEARLKEVAEVYPDMPAFVENAGKWVKVTLNDYVNAEYPQA